MARVSGKLGRVTIQGTLIVNTFEWTFEAQLETSECAIKGELVEKYGYGVMTGTITVQGFVTNTEQAELLKTFASAADTADVTSTTVVNTSLPATYSLEVLGGATGDTIDGEAIVSSISMSAPRQMATVTMTLQMTSEPTFSFA